VNKRSPTIRVIFIDDRADEIVDVELRRSEAVEVYRILQRCLSKSERSKARPKEGCRC